MAKDKHEPFPTTQWSLILRSADADSEVRRSAVISLLERYAGPMRAHLTVRKRMDAHDAEDLVQSFIMSRVLEAGVLERAERSKGRFRNFLLTSLDHFVANALRERRARKRSPERMVGIEDAAEPSSDPSADADVFDVQWARTALQEAVRRMRQSCESAKRPDLWGLFQSRLLDPAVQDTEPEPYEKVVERFGLTSPAQASNVLVTAKRMFIRILREVVGEYAADEAEIDQEIADLRDILARQRA